MKLGDALELFLGHYSKPATRRSYNNAIRPFVEGYGPEREVSDIRPAEIERYVQSLKGRQAKYADHPTRPTVEAPLSPTNIAKQIRSLKRFFNWLVELEEIPHSPARNIKVQRKRGRVSAEKTATEEEVERLLAAAYGHPQRYAMVRLMVDSGAREIGVRTLRIDDLNLEGLTATVTEKFDKVRPIWYSEETASAIKAWLRVRPGWAHRYLFGTARGPYAVGNISQQIRRLFQAAGCRSLGSHSLRHHKGYQLAESRINAKIASIALGHENVETYLEFYAPDDLSSAEAAMRETHTSHAPGKSDKIIDIRRKKTP